MSKLDEFRAAKSDADSVKAASDGLASGDVIATASAGAFSSGSETVNLHIRFTNKKNGLIASAMLARCLATAMQRSMSLLLEDAAWVANDALAAAKTKARAEAQEVLREVGP